jgi:hypothetical protein
MWVKGKSIAPCGGPRVFDYPSGHGGGLPRGEPRAAASWNWNIAGNPPLHNPLRQPRTSKGHLAGITGPAIP